MTEKWYALRIKPHKERSVVQLLQAQEVQHFFPTLRVKPKNPRAAKVKPYFPGYLFIKTDLEVEGRHAFSWVRGTYGLVSFGDIPAAVPESLILTLKRRLETLAGQREQPLYEAGEKVRIVQGPFAGYEAIFDAHLPGRERVQILLAFLSSYPKTVKLDEADIEKIE